MLADLEFTTAYLDVILMKSKNRENHAKHVTEVLKKIKEFGFILSMEKCDFCSIKDQISRTSNRRERLNP